MRVCLGLFLNNGATHSISGRINNLNLQDSGYSECHTHTIISSSRGSHALICSYFDSQVPYFLNLCIFIRNKAFFCYFSHRSFIKLSTWLFTYQEPLQDASHEVPRKHWRSFLNSFKPVVIQWAYALRPAACSFLRVCIVELRLSPSFRCSVVPTLSPLQRSPTHSAWRRSEASWPTPASWRPRLRSGTPAVTMVPLDIPLQKHCTSIWIFFCGREGRGSFAFFCIKKKSRIQQLLNKLHSPLLSLH